MGKDEETEELVKIFDTSIQTTEKKKKWVFHVRYWMPFHSMLDVRCSMLDVHLLKHPYVAELGRHAFLPD
jgi:hypothetical protein